jgi:hypothetical protein
MREHVQVEYQDGSRQWIKYCELYKLHDINIKRIVAKCSADIKSICTKKTKHKDWSERYEISQ